MSDELCGAILYISFEFFVCACFQPSPYQRQSFRENAATMFCFEAPKKGFADYKTSPDFQPTCSRVDCNWIFFFIFKTDPAKLPQREGQSLEVICNILSRKDSTSSTILSTWCVNDVDVVILPHCICSS